MPIEIVGSPCPGPALCMQYVRHSSLIEFMDIHVITCVKTRNMPPGWQPPKLVVDILRKNLTTTPLMFSAVRGTEHLPYFWWPKWWRTIFCTGIHTLRCVLFSFILSAVCWDTSLCKRACSNSLSWPASAAKLGWLWAASGQYDKYLIGALVHKTNFPEKRTTI